MRDWGIIPNRTQKKLCKVEKILLLSLCVAVQFKVTVAIFSGRPDPYRVVDTNYPKDTQVQQLLGQAKKTRTAYNPDFMPARLGYKGYVIREGAMKQSESIMGHETAPATSVKAVTGNHPERKDERDFSDRISKEITPNP